jgi:hypothetical protein
MIMASRTPITNMNELLQEKQRLKLAIQRQEHIVLQQYAQSKTDTIQFLSPTRLISNGIGHLFSLVTLRNNPFTFFRIGYKLISYLIRRKKNR